MPTRDEIQTMEAVRKGMLALVRIADLLEKESEPSLNMDKAAEAYVHASGPVEAKLEKAVLAAIG